jgi:hypothetical protein
MVARLSPRLAGGSQCPDGTESHGTLTPGVTLVARWLDPRVLATIARKGRDVIALVTYQGFADDAAIRAPESGGACKL